MSAISLVHPGRLALLLVVAALAVALVVVHRRRAAALAAYASPALASSVIPAARTGWRRHLPPVLGLLGLATIVVALAEPTRAEAVPRRQGVVVLAVDVSASMQATDVSPSRLDAAIEGAVDFVDEVPDGIHVGLVAFDGGARLVVAPTLDHGAVVDAVEDLSLGPGTAAGEALYASLDAVESSLTDDVLASGDDLPASIVLLSDGATTVGRPVTDAAAAAADEGVPVTTIAFGTPTGTVVVQGEVVAVPADTEAMARVASITGGRTFEATSAGELHDVYTDIQTAIGSTTEDRDVSRPVLAAALVLVAAATALAVTTSGRPL